MKKNILLLTVVIISTLLQGCSKNDLGISPTNLSQLENSHWKITSITSNTDATVSKNITDCKTGVWELKNGKSTTTPYSNGCYYDDYLGNKKYKIEGNKIYFATNNLDDPDTEATISFSGNTMKWYFVIDLTPYGGYKFDYTLIFTKQDATVNPTAEPNVKTPNDMIAYYPFNGNANDESGNKNNGVLKGGVNLTTDRFGKANRAYQFNDGGYILVANQPIFKISKAFSYTVWVNLSSKRGYDGFGFINTSGTQHTIFSKSCDIEESFASSLYIDDTYNNFYLISGTRSIQNETRVAFNLNQWTNFSMVYDGTQLKFYKNGSILGSKNLNIDFSKTNNSDLYLGKMGCNSHFFNGALDDFHFFNRALTETEILNIYNTEKP